MSGGMMALLKKHQLRLLYDWQRYIDLFGMPHLVTERGFIVREVPDTRYWRRRALRRSKRRVLILTRPVPADNAAITAIAR